MFSCGLPSIKAAAKQTDSTVRCVIVTDEPRRVEQWFEENWPEVEVRCPWKPTRLSQKNPWEDRHLQLGDATRTILNEAEIGECVTVLTADEIVSLDRFTTAEKYFKQGKNCIITAGGGRSSPRYSEPPIGATTNELRRWAWDNRHPWIKECTWGSGCTRLPTLLFFERDGTVVVRGFHQHFLSGFRKLRPMAFTGGTPDYGTDGLLQSSYEKEEIAVVTSPDELGFAEITPEEVRWGTFAPLSVEYVRMFAKKYSEWEWWVFSHRFFLMGNGDPGDREICDQISGGRLP